MGLIAAIIKTVKNKLVRSCLVFAAGPLCLMLTTAGLSPQSYTETVIAEDGEKLTFEMIAVPGGSFRMGSPENEPGRKEDESPQHEVSLSPFFISSTEVTLALFSVYYRETLTEKKDRPENEEQEEVDAITGPTPIYGDITMGNDLDHPAIGMSWQNAVTFCKWLSEKTGKTYRLPTEAEWEYACRAGTTSIYGTGNEERTLDSTAWYGDNSDGLTHSVGTKAPNGWGIYDMAGNVREWVSDFYGPEAYSETSRGVPAVDPQGPSSGRIHGARGGDYDSFPEELRCAARAYQMPEWRDLDPQLPKSQWWLPFMDIIGFRVVRSVEQATVR